LLSAVLLYAPLILAQNIDRPIKKSIQTNGWNKAGLGIQCVIDNQSDCPPGLDQTIIGKTSKGDAIYPVFIRHSDPDRLRQLQSNGLPINSIMMKIATARLTRQQIIDIVTDPAVITIRLSGEATPSPSKSQFKR
jgi:hypothetical protein